jgi:hypothetical protein
MDMNREAAILLASQPTCQNKEYLPFIFEDKEVK